MGKPHHRPLGLPGVHWQVMACDVLSERGGECIGVLARTDENTWSYSCDDKCETVDEEMLALVECELRRQLGRRVVVLPVRWQCRTEWGFEATVVLWHGGRATAHRSGCYQEFATAYEAFRAVEAKAMRAMPMPVAQVPAAELQRALDVLEDVLWQACGDGEELDTCALSAYAAGARLLAYYGRLRVLDEYGRRVIARAAESEGD